jgi:hypothetical protein
MTLAFKGIALAFKGIALAFGSARATGDGPMGVAERLG